MPPATLTLLAEASGVLGELKGIGRTLPNPLLLISPFQRREAVLSVAVAGSTGSVGEVGDDWLERWNIPPDRTSTGSAVQWRC